MGVWGCGGSAADCLLVVWLKRDVVSFADQRGSLHVDERHDEMVHGHTSALPAVVILLRLLGVMERTQRICWMPHQMGACRRFDTRTSVLLMWMSVAIFDVFWSALGVAHF